MMKRWLSFLMAALLCLSSAAAEHAFFPKLDFSATPMQLDLQVQAVTHMPYDEVRTGWLNDLLKHITLRSYFRQDDLEQWVKTTMLVDREAVLTMISRDSDGLSSLQLSTDPGTVYVTSGSTSAADTLFGLQGLGGDVDLMGRTGEELSLFSDAEALLALIRNDWAEAIVSKANKQTISGYGAVTRRLTLTIESAEAENFGKWLAARCPQGKLKQVIGSLSLIGTQTLTWLMDDNDRCHKFTWSGGFNAEGLAQRKLTVTWNMARTETTDKDSLSVQAVQLKDKKSESDMLTWKRSAQEKDGAVDHKLEYSYQHKLNGQRWEYSGEAELKTREEKGYTSYAGSILLARTTPEVKKEQLDLTVDLKVNEAACLVQGTVGVTTQKGKTNQESALITVALLPFANVDWSMSANTLSLDAVTQEQLAAVQTKTVNAVQQKLLRALVRLPKEDTLFLSQDLSDEAWNTIVNAAVIGE